MKYDLANDLSIELPDEYKDYQFSGLDWMVSYGQTMPTFRLILQGTEYPEEISEIKVIVQQGDNRVEMILTPHTVAFNNDILIFTGIPLPRSLCVDKKSIRYKEFSDIETVISGLEMDSEVSGDTSYDIHQINMSTRKFLVQFLRGVNKDIIFGFDTESLIIRDLNKTKTDHDKIYKYDQIGVVTDESIFVSSLDGCETLEDDYQELTTLVYGHKSLTFDKVNKRFMENYVENMRNDNELNKRSSFVGKFTMLTGYKLLDRVPIGKTMTSQELFYVTNIITSITQEGSITQTVKFS